jgi:hypothetical protein
MSAKREISLSGGRNTKAAATSSPTAATGRARRHRETCGPPRRSTSPTTYNDTSVEMKPMRDSEWIIPRRMTAAMSRKPHAFRAGARAV